MMSVRPGLLLALALMLLAFLQTAATPSMAAIQFRENATVKSACNPREAPGDIILPMPCGLYMAFRLVEVRTKGLLYDLPLWQGTDEKDQDRFFYDRRFEATIAAPLLAESLPAGWGGDRHAGHYLIGKYELTNLQWQAVMEGTANLDPDSARPRTDISWYDAVEFTKRYSQWLLENARDKLPRSEDGRYGAYVRLPTEGEWEYAARGGHEVGPAVLEDDFFPLGKDALGRDRTRNDYAVFKSVVASLVADGLAPIGSKNPNPLGLYDTAGNAAEMVLDPFRLSVGRRLHGSAGGFIRKGGSFRSDERQILPGRREEVPFFAHDGPSKARDLGVRLALSSANVPDKTRQTRLAAEWKDAGETPEGLVASPAFTPEMQPLQVLDKVISQTADPVAIRNLKELRVSIKENNLIQERQRQQVAQSLLRTGSYLIECLRNYNTRRRLLQSEIASLQKTNAEAKGQSSEKARAILNTAKAADEEFVTSLRKCFSFYRSKLDESLPIPIKDIEDAKAALERDFSGSDRFNESMRRNLSIFTNHAIARRTNALSNEKMESEILAKRRN
jgi:hypothetical protein